MSSRTVRLCPPRGREEGPGWSAATTRASREPVWHRQADGASVPCHEGRCPALRIDALRSAPQRWQRRRRRCSRAPQGLAGELNRGREGFLAAQKHWGKELCWLSRDKVSTRRNGTKLATNTRLEITEFLLLETGCGTEFPLRGRRQVTGFGCRRTRLQRLLVGQLPVPPRDPSR